MYEEFRRLYPYPEVGDTLISVVGSIGRTAEYTGKDEYFQDSNVVWLKTDGSINKKFLKISYQVINSKCDTQNEGLIKCMRAINRVAIQVKNRKIDEAEIQEYMKTGKTELPKDFKEIMDQQIQDFVDKVYRYQTECGYSLDMVPVYFVGGGAVVMRNFGRYQQSNIHYVLDVKANAKGFETMAKIALRSGR